ncbi:MAG: acetoacetate decarboxylase family protein [Hyphomicrobiales bacterium]
MPLTGTRTIARDLDTAPVVKDLGTEPWTVERCDQLQLMFELDESQLVVQLPPALHPTIPPTLLVSVLRAPDSDVGSFTLAEVRIGCRAATRPRGFLARAYCDNPQAAARLRDRWGYPVEVAEVELRRHYFDAEASVRTDATAILECRLMNPEPIGGGDVQYLANMNLAQVVRDGETVPRLIQVDCEYAIRRADRGKPMMETFAGEAWLLPGAEPVWPVSGSITEVDVTFPQLRYLVDPEKPPLQAVERVNA